MLKYTINGDSIVLERDLKLLADHIGGLFAKRLNGMILQVGSSITLTYKLETKSNG